MRASSELHETTPVFAETEVLVVGAGPAGLGAAIGAADAGADVLLVEKHGCFGGMMTAGSVINIRQYNDHRKLVVSGVAKRLADRIRAEGGTESVPEEGTHVRHDPEITKFVAQEMVLEAGVRPLLHTYVVGAHVRDKALAGIVVENKSGRGLILSRATVDATGDGDIIWHSGAEYDHDVGTQQPMTLAFVLGGVASWPKPLGRETRAKVNQEVEAGTFPTTRMLALFPMFRKGEYYANATRIPGDCTDAWDLTRGEIDGRRQVMGLVAWLRENAPGYEKCFLQSSAPQVGLRESRRLRGLYTLTRDDVLECRDFPDTIARGAYAIDIHQKGRGTEMVYLKPGQSYGIPYRCLVPETMDGLLASGRCISASHDALGSARVMAICMATGQAAGAAAALSVAAGGHPRDIEISELQGVLRQQGAIL